MLNNAVIELENQPSPRVQELRKILEVASGTMMDMSVPTAPTVQGLLIERKRLDEAIRSAQQRLFTSKFSALNNGQDFGAVQREVLTLITQADAGELKRGMVQRAVPEKATLYSLVMKARITNSTLKSVPPREELQEAFGDAWVSLVFPIGHRLSTAIPKMRSLLKAALELLCIRKELTTANEEIKDCHLELEYTSVPFDDTYFKHSRAQKKKLSAFELVKIQRLKEEGKSCAAILKIINLERSGWGYPELGLTSIKVAPVPEKTLVAESSFPTSLDPLLPKATTAPRGGTGSSCSSTGSISGDTFDDLVDDLDDMHSELDVPRPSAFTLLHTKQFNMWKEGLNL